MSSRIYQLTNSMTLKAVRNKLARLRRQVNDSQTVIPVSQRGRPVMALMSWDLFESLVDTIEIMSDPKLMAQINQSEKDVVEGRTVPLDEIMAEFNIKPGADPAYSENSD